jgi:hypothetical protein
MPRAAVLHGECYGIVGSGWRRMAPMGQAERKKRGVDVGASASGREKEERGGAWRDGRQWPPTVRRGRHHCLLNRGGRRAWATSRRGRRWLTNETRARRGPVVAVGVLERAGKRGRAVMGNQQASSGNTVPGRWFKQYFEQILNSNCFKVWSIRKVLSWVQKN